MRRLPIIALAAVLWPCAGCTADEAGPSEASVNAVTEKMPSDDEGQMEGMEDDNQGTIYF